MRSARQGCTVVVPYREEITKRHLKVTGDLGRVVFIVRTSQPQLFFKIIDRRTRNMICATQPQSKLAFATLISSTTSLAVTILPSKPHSVGYSRALALNVFRNFSLADVHVEGTDRIVDAVAKYDVDRYIHVSSHNASTASASEFFATKVRLPRTHKSIQ